MPGRHAGGNGRPGSPRSWWERQGYRPDHAVHSGTDFFSRGTAPEGQIAEEHADEERGTSAIDISVNPTRTSNPGRPRTLAAGYDYGTDTLRVVFRGGAVYDYFDVTTPEWQRFKRSASPGKFINRVLDSKEYTQIQ